ncbi:MAG: zinc ABC transporter substrate-binding protein [Myxococcales bacterium]|nr:zinc ABC transporter substrate-binding protein [Myxococcales bacterium]
MNRRRPRLAYRFPIVFMLLLFLAACQPSSAPVPEPAGKPWRVVATVLPLENLVMAVTQGAAEVEVQGLLPPAGGCPHDYSLTPGDLKKLEAADALVVVGLDYEPFLGKLAENFGNRLPVIVASDGVEVLAAPADADEEEKADHPGEAEHHHGEHEHHHGEVNDHPFVSPKQAALMARTVAVRLAQLNPENAAVYTANAEKLAGELTGIQTDLAAFVATLPNKQVVVVDPIFGYLLRDIGLETAAVLVPHHQGALSAGTLSRLSRKFQRQVPAVVLNESQFDARVAQTFAAEIKAKAATISTPFDTAPGPAAFVEQMRKMAGELKAALGR